MKIQYTKSFVRPAVLTAIGMFVTNLSFSQLDRTAIPIEPRMVESRTIEPRNSEIIQVETYGIQSPSPAAIKSAYSLERPSQDNELGNDATKGDQEKQKPFNATSAERASLLVPARIEEELKPR